MIPPSSADLNYFLEVSVTKNISRAAERLGISQPSLSTALQRLEANLGASLLLRKKSGVELTRAGHLVADRARGLLQEWENIRTEVKRGTHELIGTYSLGCHVSVAQYTLRNFLPQLLSQHLQLEFNLEHDLSRKVTERVVSHHLDFGIVVNPVSHPDLIIHELCRDRVSLWSVDGEMRDTLLVEPSLQQSQWILQKLEKRREKFRRRLTSTSLEVIAHLAAEGLGVAILPTRVAMLGHRLKLVRGGLPFFNDRVCLVYRADMQRSEAARLIVKAIASCKYSVN